MLAVWRGNSDIVCYLLSNAAPVLINEESEPLAVMFLPEMMHPGAPQPTSRTSSIRHVSVHGIAPLHLALISNSIPLIECLLKSGAHINSGPSLSSYGPPIATPLMMAALLPAETTATVIHLLNDAGVDLMAKDHLGRTALHVAASRCNVEAVAALIGLGVDPLVVDLFGRTPRTTPVELVNEWASLIVMMAVQFR